MRKATKKDLENLKIWEQIIKKRNSIYYEKYIYQWKVIHKNWKTTMQWISEYLIICCWSKCETIFMWRDDEIWINWTFFIWEYDNKFILKWNY